MTHIFTVLFHIQGIGASVSLEDGSAAMSFAMDLERQDYVVKVYKYPEGDPHAEQDVYESDEWIPVMEAKEQHGRA